jgi:hypothetical protein
MNRGPVHGNSHALRWSGGFGSCAQGAAGDAACCNLDSGGVACRRCFRHRYQSPSLDWIGPALNAMGKIAKQIDPEAVVNLQISRRVCTGPGTIGSPLRLLPRIAD